VNANVTKREISFSIPAFKGRAKLMPPLPVEDRWLSTGFAWLSPLTSLDVLRRRATVEFSPVFQGWDRTPTYNPFVALATVETLTRR